MTGLQFENAVCDMFQSKGFWALRIPKNERGAQPFDIIAIRGDEVHAVDCKVCSRKLFPLSRIEDNQWVALEVMREKTYAKTGFVLYHKERVYYIPFDEAVMAQYVGKASIPLDDEHEWRLR